MARLGASLASSPRQQRCDESQFSSFLELLLIPPAHLSTPPRCFRRLRDSFVVIIAPELERHLVNSLQIRAVSCLAVPARCFTVEFRSAAHQVFKLR